MKKLCALLLSLCLLCGTVPAVFAAPAEASAELYLTNSAVVNAALPVAASGDTATEYLYYDQLDADQQAIYEALRELSPDDLQITIPLRTPLQFSSATRNPTEAEQADANARLHTLMQGAIDALFKDDLSLFWVKLGKNGSSYSWSMSGSKPLFSDSWTWTIDKIVFTAVVDSPYANQPKSHIAALEQAVEDFTVTGDTLYQQLRSMHDYLCDTVTYVLNGIYAHEAYGGLVAGEAVCEGYAKAFKLLCDKYDIPCVLVIGTSSTNKGSEGHMWNYVQMDDGNWYAVDVTWDDQTSLTYYDFFLVGADTTDTYFGKKTFSNSHIESGDFSGGGILFAYPELHSAAYHTAHTAGDWVTEGEPTPTEPGERVKYCTVCGDIVETESIPATGEEPLLRPDSPLTPDETTGYLHGTQPGQTAADIAAQFTKPAVITTADGSPLPENAPIATGYMVTVNDITYTLVLAGDVNSDSEINSTDARWTLQYAVSEQSLTPAQQCAADETQDESIDSKDARWILQLAVA